MTVNRELTVNTHKGLFTYKVLHFGVSSSPAIFQRTIEGVLQGIPQVGIFLDDILLTGRNDREHFNTLKVVFKKTRLFLTGARTKGLWGKRQRVLMQGEDTHHA